MTHEYTPLNDEPDTSSIWSNCGLTKQDCKALGHCSAPTPRSDDGELDEILLSLLPCTCEEDRAKVNSAANALRAREARIVSVARLDGAIEQLQKSKRYYGRPLHGGIDRRINKLKKELAALTPKSTPKGRKWADVKADLLKDPAIKTAYETPDEDEAPKSTDRCTNPQCPWLGDRAHTVADCPKGNEPKGIVTGIYDRARDIVRLSNGNIVPWVEIRDYCKVTADGTVHRYEPTGTVAHEGPKMMGSLTTWSTDLSPFAATSQDSTVNKEGE
jgi:hypothetical protein